MRTRGGRGDGDAEQEVHTERDTDVATPNLTVSHRLAAGSPSQAPEPLPPEAASHQVVVGDIPAEPLGFQPRAGLLAELDRAGARVSVIYAVTGLPGLGTTELAAAHARAKLEAGWRLVAWVNGADTGSLLGGLAAVADATGLTYDDSGPGTTDAAAMVRLSLETDGDRCLLVFDNVSDPELLQEFVPAHGTARVLITSPRQAPANLGNTIPVNVFSTAEASAFLARRTGLDDEAGAAAVAAALGHLPLALALAAPVIAGQRAGYASYLDRLQATSADVSLTPDGRQPYAPSFAQTVLLSLQAVRAADRTGVCTRVMEIMSVLSAAGVRRELLHAAGQAGVLASGRHRIAAGPVDRVLKWLSERSLLTFSLDGQTVILHHLVARVIRNELDRRQMVTAVCEAAAFVLDVYSRALVGSHDRRAVREVPQQVTALLDCLGGPVIEVDEELGWLLLRLQFVAFYHLLELGDSTPQAIAVGEPLAQDLERLLGPDHPDTLNSRNSLAAAYLAAGRVAEAIPLFEQTLTVRQRTLGPDDPETLTSQNNLASAYQDAGRTAEAIRLYEQNLEARERLLGPDHSSTLNSRGNLAAAYQDAGRAAEAIPLLERTLADRERVLGPDHPDAQTSRKNLARAYQEVGRAAEAIPLLERTSADRKRVLRPDHLDAQTSRKNFADAFPPAGQTVAARKSQLPDGAAGQMLPAGFRRPPADQARRVLPAGLRRPPADPARQPLPNGVARPPAKLVDHPSNRTQEPPKDVEYRREMLAAITAEDPAGIAIMYDKYAADLYDYCHWMLHDSADAARALKNTFVIAAATLSKLSEPSKLRPWLFALARDEGRRRIRPKSAARNDETDAMVQPDDEVQPADEVREASDATVTFRAVGVPADATRKAPGATRKASGATREASDATMTFRALALSSDVTSEASDVTREASDATMTFRALGLPSGATREASDATMSFRALGLSSDVTSEASDVTREASDATVTFRALGPPSGATREASDATLPFAIVGLPSDATMSFRVVSQPARGPAHLNGDRGESELRTLIYSILAGLKPREREVIELSSRHDLRDDDLAIALGVSSSRAHALASAARGRLEEALNALHIALTRRETCPVLGELLAGWDGQLTEDTRDLVSWHIGECQTCAHHGWGALRPAAFSRLLPPAPLPPELREQVLSSCTSTAEDAVAYRRRAVRRAESIWFTTFSRAIRHVSWAGIRANPGRAIVALAVVLWVAAAASITLLALAGSHAAYAQPAGRSATHAYAPQTGAGTSAGSPAAAPATATTRTSAASPSPSFTRPASYVSSPVQPSPSPEASKSSKPSTSPSPKSSTSPSPKPSTSSSSGPSKSPSSGPSTSSSSSVSPTP
jgi:RNA polymerase sigma factor (sigma-70 family)